MLTDKAIKRITPFIFFAIFVIAILVALATPYLVNHYSSFYDFKTDKPNEIGDSIGGVLGPAVAIIASALTFLAFWVQYKANIEQNEYIRKQRFEDTFFRLLENHQNIVDGIDFRKTGNKTETLATGRDCFKEMHTKFVGAVVTIPSNSIIPDLSLKNVNKEYDVIQNRYRSDLHHYYRFIYRFLKFIKEADIDENEKYKYASIYRAVFSAYELPMIFYNGLHPFGKKLKPLLEEFSFLKNTDDTLIFQKSHYKSYHLIAYSNDHIDRKKLLEDWKKVQLSGKK